MTFRGNLALRKNAAWGTSIYTDDSDVVTSEWQFTFDNIRSHSTELNNAVLVHDGWYKPIDAPEAAPLPVPEKETFIKVEAPEGTISF